MRDWREFDRSRSHQVRPEPPGRYAPRAPLSASVSGPGQAITHANRATENAMRPAVRPTWQSGCLSTTSSVFIVPPSGDYSRTVMKSSTLHGLRLSRAWNTLPHVDRAMPCIPANIDRPKAEHRSKNQIRCAVEGDWLAARRSESRSPAKRPDLRREAAMERAKGIEPSYAAWEAAVLPLNYARVRLPLD